MRTVRQEKLYAGKAWLRDKDMDRLEAGETIQAKYVGRKIQLGSLTINQGDLMTITPEDLPTLREGKSDKKFDSRFGNHQYWLWGIDFKPDVDKQPALFSA